MSWVTYPYFWGRKNEWPNRLAFDDPDPLFRQFLKAGYCRVVVPMGEGFEGAIDHFMHFGEPWFGGPLPPITSPLYLPIAQEIAERLDRPGDEIPQGDPWEVRLPPSSVCARTATCPVGSRTRTATGCPCSWRRSGHSGAAGLQAGMGTGATGLAGKPCRLLCLAQNYCHRAGCYGTR